MTGTCTRPRSGLVLNDLLAPLLQINGAQPDVTPTFLLLPGLVLGDQWTSVSRQVMGRRCTDEKWHALLEPQRSCLPTEQAELLSLQHMDVLVLHDVGHPRLGRKDDAPIEYGCAALNAAARANWMAVTPMPLVPPCTNRVSPFCRRPRSNTLLQTVKKVSGNAAASSSDRPWGTGRHCATGATHSSA